MPYKRRPAYKKRARRVRAPRRVAPVVKSYVKRQINKNIEEFQLTHPAGSFPMSPSVGLIAISEIPSANRASTEATIKSIRYMVDVKLPVTGTITNLTTNCRFIVFQWKGTSTPVVSDILNDTTQSQICISPYKFDFSQRYTILRDFKFHLSPQTRTYQKLVYNNYKTRPMKYDDTGLPPLANKLIYSIQVCDNTTINDQPIFTYNNTIKYHDA